MTDRPPSFNNYVTPPTQPRRQKHSNNHPNTGIEMAENNPVKEDDDGYLQPVSSKNNNNIHEMGTKREMGDNRVNNKIEETPLRGHTCRNMRPVVDIEQGVSCADNQQPQNDGRQGASYSDNQQPQNGGRQLENSNERSAGRQRQGGNYKNLRKKQEEYSILFGTFERPPWYMVILIAFQHFIVMFGACVTVARIIASNLCLGSQDNTAVAEIVGTTFFCSGFATLLQSVIGVRVPIVQAGSFTYLAPLLAIMNTPEWACSSILSTNPDVQIAIPGYNVTSQPVPSLSTYSVDVDTGPRPWKVRMVELQGAVLVASAVETLIGCSGVLGFILQWIGPLVVTPTITLIGLDLFQYATDLASQNWPFALLTILLMAIFSQYTRSLKLPILHYNRKDGFTRASMPVLVMLPVILSISVSWIIYSIFSVTNIIAKPDVNMNGTLVALENTPWFRFPYPFQWGLPTLTTASFVAVLAGVVASIVESIGDYFACARMSGNDPPPDHAINRGIAVEGLGNFIFGMFGCGTGTTSYSENIGTIGVTKVASRRVLQVAALFMIVFGIFIKFCHLFVAIPEPIMGGVFIVMFAMIVGIGLSNLQYVDLNSTRNLFVVGLSFFFGISIPRFLNNRNDTSLTGIPLLDSFFTPLLKSGNLVGGLSAFILDITIPGSKRERGLKTWREHKKRYTAEGTESKVDTYGIPFLSRFITDKPWARYVPFLPTFKGFVIKKELFRSRRNRREEADQ